MEYQSKKKICVHLHSRKVGMVEVNEVQIKTVVHFHKRSKMFQKLQTEQKEIMLCTRFLHCNE